MSLNFRPKIDKIVELLLYISHKKPGVDKYQVVKLLYLADKEHLNRYGRPITQEQYFALPYGPVASNAMDLLEEDRRILREAGIDELPFYVAQKRLKKKSVESVGGPKRDVNFELFSKSDIRVFDEILEKYGEYDFEQLFDLTHEHYAYLRAWNARKPQANRSPMRYEDMIDDEKKRASILEEIGPIAPYVE